MLSASAAAISPWLGFAAALWAVAGAGALADSAGGAGVAVLGIGMVGSAMWFRSARRQRIGRMSTPTTLVAPQRAFAMPPGLDGGAVLEAARARFLRLQAAWDAGDVAALRTLTTPEMLAELMAMLPARGEGATRTDVVTLHAELIGLEELSAAYLACVEFSGLICESVEQGAVPFRELWMLAGSKDDGDPSWRLARQQALL